jgi:hypothetical protein
MSEKIVSALTAKLGPFKWKREHDNQGGSSKETDVAYKMMQMCVDVLADDDVC